MPRPFSCTEYFSEALQVFACLQKFFCKLLQVFATFYLTRVESFLQSRESLHWRWAGSRDCWLSPETIPTLASVVESIQPTTIHHYYLSADSVLINKAKRVAVGLVVTAPIASCNDLSYSAWNRVRSEMVDHSSHLSSLPSARQEISMPRDSGTVWHPLPLPWLK